VRLKCQGLQIACYILMHMRMHTVVTSTNYSTKRCRKRAILQWFIISFLFNQLMTNVKKN